jgi:predicted nucleic acid-binding protein
MSRSLFVDTWGWIALGHNRDPAHANVSRFYREHRSQKSTVYTSDYVLDEVITLLFRRERFDSAKAFLDAMLADVNNGRITLERITAPRFDRAWELRCRLHDKMRISFTDLTSMTIMDELGIVDVLTDDQHFSHVGMGFRRVPAES